MAEAQSLPLLSQYSDVFTRLHDGKKTCFDYGIDRVALNRFIIDASINTSQPDMTPLLSMVDLEKVPDGDTQSEKKQFCENKLKELVALQEEVNTLQKVAREKGIAGGLLTIVGQASIQSPSDHGASVIHQLSALMDNGDAKPQPATVDGNALKTDTDVALQDAANDSHEEALSPPAGGLQGVMAMAKANWQPLSVDVLFCLIASFFAISLVS